MFVWNTYEAPRVVPGLIFRHVNVNPVVFPRKQTPRHSSKEHSNVVKEEVNKLK